MPLLKRKAVEPLPPPDPPKEGEPEPEVFYMVATGEIFNDYDSYTNRLAWFNQPIFQCELTGKLNLTYSQALDSERQEAIMLHRRFPESLKGPILRSVQFTITGRLDDLVNAVHDRFQDRYFAGEQVYVDLAGERFYASIKTVYPPRSLLRQHQEAALATQRSQKKQRQNPDSDSDLTEEEPEYPPIDAESVIHRIGTDIDQDIAKANELDNPEDYLYALQLSDEDGKFTGSLMEARASALRRDRLTFSKTILKKYLKEATVRESTVASPWVVRHVLAQRYGIDITPSEAVIRKNQEQKDIKLGKRRKLPPKEFEDSSAAKNGEPPNKKRKGAEGADAGPAEKKKVIKYPIEDLDVPPISTKELKYTSADGMARIRCRPIPSRSLPVPKELFEPLMMVYYFCIAVGKPLGLSSFTLDDFEAALRHNTHDPSCTLVSEMHGSLLNCIMRDGSFSKELAPAALESKALEKKVKEQERARMEKGRSASRGRSEEMDELNSNLDEDEEEKDKIKDETDPEIKEEERIGEVGDDDDDLTDEEYDEEERSVMVAAGQIGRGWEKKILKPEDGRPGWEKALVGCLLKRATTRNLPRLVGILSQLTGVSHPEGTVGRPDGIFDCDTYESEVQRYPTLPLGDKLAALQFLCELAVMTKVVRAFFDECETNLTELRKEKLDFTRVKKKLIEDRAAFEASQAEKGEGSGQAQGNENGTPAIENGNASRSASRNPSVDLNGDTSMATASESFSAPASAPKAAAGDSDSEKDELDSDQDELEGDDESMSDVSGDLRPTSRQAKLREQTMKREAAAAERNAELSAGKKMAAAKRSEQRAKKSEQQRIEEEEIRTVRREEIFEREFRKYYHAARMRPLGKDRFYDSYWWFDGVGNANLMQAGQVLYGTGRIFVQGPSQEDWDMLQRERKISEIESRRKDECLEEGLLGIGEWAVYEQAEEIDALIAWLRNKGRRELGLRNELLKFRDYIEPGMKKRQADRAAEVAAAESRRSTRKYEKQPYMLYRNMIAK